MKELMNTTANNMIYCASNFVLEYVNAILPLANYSKLYGILSSYYFIEKETFIQ